MKILIVSDQETSGGAATSTTNLVNGLLLSREDEVYRLVAFHDSRSYSWQRIEFWQRDTLVKKVFMRVFQKLPRAARNRLANRRFRRILKEIRPDVVNFHNILWGREMGMNVEMFSIASEFCKTFVTMHDMWTIVGFPYDLRVIRDKRILDGWTLPEVHVQGRSESEMVAERESVFRENPIRIHRSFELDCRRTAGTPSFFKRPGSGDPLRDLDRYLQTHCQTRRRQHR
ncbi:hypothetical protein ACQ86N_42670 [Puia sp. P3]|uniref:hypothetical protein n=1 Tax=Puia sp. P3 TaxID=3423952 RepID=UPI003D678CA7